MQIAKSQAKNVIIALSNFEEKLEHCLANGADYLINYKTTNYVEEVMQITGGKDVNVSINSVEEPTLLKDPLAVTPLGRCSLNEFAAGKGAIDPYERL